jgi:DNA-binding response OmpR family regulator
MKTLNRTSSELVVGGPTQNLSPASVCRILLVDDDILLRKLLAGALISSGYQVDTAADGAYAWEALHEVRYDLLITDHTIPRMAGLELLKKLDFEAITLPVIMASGMVPIEELERHAHPQLEAALTKPFTISELLDTVEKVLTKTDEVANSSSRESVSVDDKIPTAERPAKTPIQDQINPSHRILVVDDDRDVRQLSIDLLTGSGYEVKAVTDGAAGWIALQAGDFDLVLTDNKMPNMTGLEMIARLRSAHLPVSVIMATGLLPMEELARKPWLKPDGLLQRPFSNDELLATVKNVLDSHEGDDGDENTLLTKYL